MTPGRGVCGILVTYNPDPAVLKEVLAAAVPQLDRLIVIDNGSELEVAERIRAVLSLSPGGAGTRTAVVEERFFPENRGLPIAFNEALRLARSAGGRFALFLDHDSILEATAVQQLLDTHDRLSDRVPLGALEAFNEEPVVHATDDFLEGYFRRRGLGLGEGISDDFLATNSGLFVPMPVFDRVGMFDDAYFVDAVDFEFGLRVRAAGLRVLRVSAARIRHRRGEVGKGQGLAGRVRSVWPVRHYYVARDVLRTLRRYGRRFPLVGLVLLSMPIREAFLVLFFYSHRTEHLRFLALGVVDAVRGVRGRYPGPIPSVR